MNTSWADLEGKGFTFFISIHKVTLTLRVLVEEYLCNVIESWGAVSTVPLCIKQELCHLSSFSAALHGAPPDTERHVHLYI